MERQGNDAGEAAILSDERYLSRRVQQAEAADAGSAPEVPAERRPNQRRIAPKDAVRGGGVHRKDQE